MNKLDELFKNQKAIREYVNTIEKETKLAQKKATDVSKKADEKINKFTNELTGCNDNLNSLNEKINKFTNELTGCNDNLNSLNKKIIHMQKNQDIFSRQMNDLINKHEKLKKDKLKSDNNSENNRKKYDRVNSQFGECLKHKEKTLNLSKQQATEILNLNKNVEERIKIKDLKIKELEKKIEEQKKVVQESSPELENLKKLLKKEQEKVQKLETLGIKIAERIEETISPFLAIEQQSNKQLAIEQKYNQQALVPYKK
jgi:chromosome segregation ATPase